jgi:hypothetical protein
MITKKQHSMNITSESAEAVILKAARQVDCDVTQDKHGHYALMERHYDDAGISLIRHRPDPCNHHAPEEWVGMISSGRTSEWIC